MRPQGWLGTSRVGTGCACPGRSDAVSKAVDDVVEALVAENRVPKWRNETFDVMPGWGDKPLFRIDRGAVPFFGTRAYGVHLNGYRFEGGRLHLWIGRRAPWRKYSPPCTNAT